MPEAEAPPPIPVELPLTWKEKLAKMEVGDSYPVGTNSRHTILQTARVVYGTTRKYTIRKLPPMDELYCFRLPDPEKSNP